MHMRARGCRRVFDLIYEALLELRMAARGVRFSYRALAVLLGDDGLAWEIVNRLTGGKWGAGSIVDAG